MFDKRQCLRVFSFSAGLLGVLVGSAALAATITVNSFADPGAAGTCALRDAITAANTMTATNGCAAGTGNDTIQFSVTGTILLGGPLPGVIGTLTINGPVSPGITIDGDGKFQVMRVAFGATLNLNNMTISNGFDSDGGGIFDDGTLNIASSRFSGNSATFTGGGIRIASAMEPSSARKLTVTNSTFSGNRVGPCGEFCAPSGGAIRNAHNGILIITNSTFSGNSSANSGGGIAVVESGATVINSTFFGNSAGNGGAIYKVGVLTLINSTISGNTAAAGGGIWSTHFFGLPAVVRSTILAANSGNNCFFDGTGSAFNDVGYNISDDSTCGFTKTGSANNGDGIDPLLSPAGLADNGGPTQTIALQSSSPAIDAIPVADCTDQASPPNPITTDQRGLPRPDAKEQVCDIGAYEFQDSAPFAGQPGKPNCHGKSVSALDQHFGSLDAAASGLGFSSVKALQDAIKAFCKF